MIKSQVEALRDDVQKMRDGKIAIAGGIAVEPRGVLVRITDPAERAKALSLLQSLSQPIGGPPGGRKRPHARCGGDRKTARLSLTDAATADKIRHAVGQSIGVERRINAMGTKETVIQQQGYQSRAD